MWVDLIHHLVDGQLLGLSIETSDVEIEDGELLPLLRFSCIS